MMAAVCASSWFRRAARTAAASASVRMRGLGCGGVLACGVRGGEDEEREGGEGRRRFKFPAAARLTAAPLPDKRLASESSPYDETPRPTSASLSLTLGPPRRL